MNAPLPPYFIAEQPIVEIEGGMVWLKLQSDASPRLAVPRSTWRRFLECQLIRLNDFEMDERDKVVDLREAERAKAPKPVKPRRRKV